MSNLYRSCLRVGEGCTIPSRSPPFNIYQTAPSATSKFTSNPQGGNPVCQFGQGGYPALTRVRGRDCFPSCPSRTFSHRLQSHCRGCPPLHLPPFWRLGRGSCLPLPASNTISGCQTFSLLLHSKTHLFQARKRRHKGPLCTWHVGPTNGPVEWETN